MSKTIIKVDPLKSVNEAEFGITREEVRKILGKPADTFSKDDGETETDDYETFHVFYDEEDRFEAIEVFCEDCEIYYNGKKLTDQFDDLLEYFEDLFDDTEEDDCGFITIEGSVGAYVEDEEEGVAYSILFGRKGYYEDPDE